jgi:hypothetical protein
MPAAPLTRYGLAELLTLALDLLSPILDPLFGGIDDTPPVRTTTPPPAETPPVPPAIAPTPDDVAEPVILIGLPRPIEAEFSGSMPENSAISPSAECGATPDVAPLYVRRGNGKGARYGVAPPDAVGPRFRRLTVGRRVKWTPVEADR